MASHVKRFQAEIHQSHWIFVRQFARAVFQLQRWFDTIRRETRGAG